MTPIPFSDGNLAIAPAVTFRDVQFQGNNNCSGFLKSLVAAASILLPGACAPAISTPAQTTPLTLPLNLGPTYGSIRTQEASLADSIRAFLPGGCVMQSEVMVPGKSTTFQNFENAMNRVSSLHPAMGIDRIPVAIQHLAPSVPLIRVGFKKEEEDGKTKTIGSMGSGIIVDGTHVLTNKHVITAPDGFERIPQLRLKVYNQGGKPVEVMAKVVAESDKYDLAVLEMDVPKGVTIRPAAFRINNVIQGLPVVAIGNPVGLENTATAGIISQIDVDVTNILPFIDPEYHVPLILTDTAVNPGNSGGALGDLDGSVVGMPSFILPSMPGMPRQNLSFAYPSQLLVDYLRDAGLKPDIKRAPPLPNINTDQIATKRQTKLKKLLYA